MFVIWIWLDAYQLVYFLLYLPEKLHTFKQEFGYNSSVFIYLFILARPILWKFKNNVLMIDLLS